MRVSNPDNSAERQFGAIRDFWLAVRAGRAIAIMQVFPTGRCALLPSRNQDPGEFL
ncbi:MAG: hypothetical protein KME08_08795 [Aphanothece sp. CMT-3BRIN-NPC111]|jgi:hypothetical protein|nr:hypothetical protein [Aphanothece sp. CMT-3BRIN-NPC111]